MQGQEREQGAPPEGAQRSWDGADCWVREGGSVGVTPWLARPLCGPLSTPPPASQRSHRSRGGGAPARLPRRAAASRGREGGRDLRTGSFPLCCLTRKPCGQHARAAGRPGSCLAKLPCQARRPEGSGAEVAAESPRAALPQHPEALEGTPSSLPPPSTGLCSGTLPHKTKIADASSGRGVPRDPSPGCSAALRAASPAGRRLPALALVPRGRRWALVEGRALVSQPSRDKAPERDHQPEGRGCVCSPPPCFPNYGPRGGSPRRPPGSAPFQCPGGSLWGERRPAEGDRWGRAGKEEALP